MFNTRLVWEALTYVTRIITVGSINLRVDLQLGSSWTSLYLVSLSQVTSLSPNRTWCFFRHFSVIVVPCATGKVDDVIMVVFQVDPNSVHSKIFNKL